jgi:hypothetical protein
MATLENFVRRDNLYVAKVTLTEGSPINKRLLKKGCIYAGSYVMALVHPDKINADNINIFYPKKVKFEQYLPRAHFELIYTSVNFMSMDVVVGATITRKKNIIVYNISTTLSNYNLVYHFEDYVDLDKCATRLYYNSILNCIELAIPIDELEDPYSPLLNWNYKLRIDTDVINSRYTKYSHRKFLIYLYDDSNVESCIICRDLTKEKTLNTKCCNNVYHYSCMSKWNDCEPGTELSENKCRCPMCRALNIHSKCPLIVCVDFKTWKLVKCYDCNTIFPHKRQLAHTMYCYDCA